MVKEAHRKIKARRQTELLAGKDLIWLMWLGTFLSETSVELSVHSEPLCICWAGGRHGARWSSPATTSRHMTGWWELNQQIQRCDQVEEIYGICKASIGAMDHRNLTAAMYRLAKLKGGSLQSRRTRDEEHEQVCRMIVGRALEHVQSFGPREIPIFMWSLAKMRYQPGAELLVVISRRAVATSGEFIPQGVANLMWSLATLGLEPAAELTAAMSRQAAALSREFNQQEFLNLMWSLAVLEADIETEIWRRFLHASIVSGDTLSDAALSQLHQIALCMELGLIACPLTPEEALGPLSSPRCRAAFERSVPRGSRLQRSVGRRLQAMGLALAEEAREPRTGYSIDFVVRRGAAEEWALEVDGPSHFVRGGARPRRNGATLLKRRVLERVGWRVAAVDYWVWGECSARGAAAEREYLEGLLQIAPGGGNEAQ